MATKDARGHVDDVTDIPSSAESNSTFAQVVFLSVDESYAVGANVECRYTLSAGLETSSRDWVGLYRVGWRVISEYVYYEWAPATQQGKNGGAAEHATVIVFPGGYLFCYCVI